MRVLHICNSIAGNYFQDLTNGLVAAGCEVVLVSLLPQRSTDATSNFASLGAKGRAGFPAATLRLSRLLKERSISVLQTHLFDSGIVGLGAARLAGIPVIHTRHHQDLHALMGKTLHQWLDVHTALASDAVIVPSTALRRYLINNEGIPESKIDVVEFGYDFERLRFSSDGRNRVRREFGVGSEDFLVGMIASFHPLKGHEFLLQALPEIVRGATNARLFLIGQGDRSQIERRLANSSLEDRVIFAGQRSDIVDCISALDVLVHPSLSESFGQVVVEAMATGVPVVATPLGIAAEIIKDGTSGRIIPQRDPAAIADAVLFLYRNPCERGRISSVARQIVVARFTVENMVAGHLSCYRKVLEKAPE